MTFGVNRKKMSRVATVITVTAMSLAACGDGGGGNIAGPEESKSTDFFGYQVNAELETTNAATAFGAANQAQLLAGRLYPSAYVPGPSGQMIPNTDLVEAVEHTGDSRKVVYTINPEAAYSDGEKITCDDFYLSYKAGSDAARFGSHVPLMEQVETFRCAPGAKKFSVSFKKDMGQRWRHLFGPGTVMPAHAIAEKAGVEKRELTEALKNDNAAVVDKAAKAWRYGFHLDHFDPAIQVSSGPFKIDKVGEQGEVVLVTNDSYYGDKPTLKTLVVWPKSADSAAIHQEQGLQILDADKKEPEWWDRNAPDNPFTSESLVGELTDTLVLSDAGTLGQQWARQAFNACVDQKGLAAASSKYSGVKVPPVYYHVIRHSDPMHHQLDSTVKEFKGVDKAVAAGLSGNEIKVGYVGPDDRKKAMVESLQRSCEPAGITIKDVSSESTTQLDLQPGADGNPAIDVFLGEVDPLTEHSDLTAEEFNAKDLAAAEKQMWEDLKSIPVAAEPRVFLMDRNVRNVVPYTGLSGIGWNMDRWEYPEDDSGND